MPDELDDVLHAANMYLRDVVDNGEVPLDRMSSLRLQTAIEAAVGILDYPVMLGGSRTSGTEMVAQSMSHLFAVKAREAAINGQEPLDHLEKYISAALAIGTMMGYVIGMAMAGEGDLIEEDDE